MVQRVLIVLNPIGCSVNVYCALRDSRSDRRLFTPPKMLETRESTFVTAPVAGTMLAACAYNGRPSTLTWPSCSPEKFTSTGDCWLRLSEYVASAEKRKSFVMSGPRSVRLPRQLRCDWKPGSIAQTFDRLLMKDG